jgi:hypothetical protein
VNVRLATVLAILALAFASIWVGAAISEWLILAAVTVGPIAAVAVGFSGMGRR